MKKYRLKQWYPSLLKYVRVGDIITENAQHYKGVTHKGISYRVEIWQLHPDFWELIEDQRLATEEEKQMLFNALKKEGFRWNADKLEIEKLDISEIVVDYESAIKYLGIKDLLLVFKNYDRAEKFNAQIKLQLIAEAWNKFDEFEADWGNIDQHKHYPILRVKDGKIEFSHTCFVRRFINSYTSNFSFKSEERATQFGNQFIDLFKIALGI